jgi:hypothetical protein
MDGASLPDQPRTAPDVCPGCGCEAELYPRGNGWRCGDCLAELLSDALTGPTIPTIPTRVQVRALPPRPRPNERQAAIKLEPAERAVA